MFLTELLIVGFECENQEHESRVKFAATGGVTAGYLSSVYLTTVLNEIQVKVHHYLRERVYGSRSTCLRFFIIIGESFTSRYITVRHAVCYKVKPGVLDLVEISIMEYFFAN